MESEQCSQVLDKIQIQQAENLISQLAMSIATSSSEKIGGRSLKELFVNINEYRDVQNRILEINPAFTSKEARLITSLVGGGKEGVKKLISKVETQLPGHTYLTARRLVVHSTSKYHLTDSDLNTTNMMMVGKKLIQHRQSNQDSRYEQLKASNANSKQNNIIMITHPGNDRKLKGAEGDYCYPANERFRPVSCDIGMDLSKVRDGEYFTKQRKEAQYECTLERCRRNEERVTEAYKYKREAHVLDAEKRVRGIMHQRAAYLDKVQERATMDRLKRNQY